MTCGRDEAIHVINVTYGQTDDSTCSRGDTLKDVGQSLQQKYSENGVGEVDAPVRLKHRILYSEILASEHSNI